MYKKIFLTFILFYSYQSSYSQSIDDVYRLNSFFHNGSARFNSMGGAFGALGGDISAISINPSGSSVFLDSEIGFNINFSNITTTNNFNNNISESKSDFFSVNNVGTVLVFGNNKSKLSLGYNMHNLNNYDNNFSFSGNSSLGLDNYFLFYAQGIPYEDLIVYDNETIRSVYEFLGEEYGFSDQQAFLGFQSFIINPNEEGDYNSNALYSTINQNIDIQRKGAHNMHTFNISKSIRDNFLVGLNINIHELFFNELKTVSDNNFDYQSIVNSISFDDDLYTTGIGTSIQLGSILILDRLRIGYSYQSPTWFSIEDESIQRVRTEIFEDDKIVQYKVDPNTINYFEEYNFRIPSKSTFSLAYVFGSRGLISIDYELSNPANSNFRDNNGDDQYFKSLNKLIKQRFSSSANSLRIGGEYRIKNYSFRVGGFTYDSVLNERDNLISGISFGLGYNFGNFHIDFGYTKIENNYSNNLFSNGLNSSYSIENLTNQIYSSISIKL